MKRYQFLDDLREYKIFNDETFNEDFEDMELRDILFERCTFSYGFSNTVLNNVEFIDCTFQDGDFKYAILKTVRVPSQSNRADDVVNTETLVRQAKLGITGKVKVLTWKGLANHHYRVLCYYR